MIIIKKIIILFLCSLFSLLFLSNPKIKVKAIDDSSKSSILMDIDHNRILYEKNSNEKHLTASIAKIMTCLVAIENGDLKKICVVDEQTTKQIGSSIYLKLNDKIYLKDLLYGLMLRSGNDAAYLISISVSNNVDSFVLLMNKTAKKINMNNTIFENPSGLDESTKNYSTAYDMALLMAYAMKNKTFREIVNKTSYSFTSINGDKITFYNKHKLVNSNEYCIGGKTGYTELANRTLVTCFSKNNINVVIVTFDCGNDWNVHESLFEYAITNYQIKTFITQGIIDYDYISYDVTPIIYENVTYIINKNEKVNCEIELLERVNNETIIGIIKLYINNKVVKEVFIYRYY